MNLNHIANNFLANFAGPETYHLVLIDWDDSVISSKNFNDAVAANATLNSWYNNGWLSANEVFTCYLNGHSFAFYYFD